MKGKFIHRQIWNFWLKKLKPVQEHTECYKVTLMKVGNKIESPHPTIGLRKIQLRFTKHSSLGGSPWNRSKDIGLSVNWVKNRRTNLIKGQDVLKLLFPLSSSFLWEWCRPTPKVITQFYVKNNRKSMNKEQLFELETKIWNLTKIYKF